MSINTINKEAIERRITHTDEPERIERDKPISSHGRGYKAVREYKEKEEIEKLHDPNDYYESLLKE